MKKAPIEACEKGRQEIGQGGEESEKERHKKYTKPALDKSSYEKTHTQLHAHSVCRVHRVYMCAHSYG